MVTQDIWLVWYHIIMPFRMKNDIGALCTRKSYQVVSALTLIKKFAEIINPNMVLSIPDETSKDAEYKLAQSGDATCNGLDSAEVCTHMNRYAVVLASKSFDSSLNLFDRPFV